jgi:ankyrin repeat protein
MNHPLRLTIVLLVAFQCVATCGAAQTPAAAAVDDATARLQQAAMNGDVAQIRTAIAAHQPIDAPGASHMTALGIAALYGRADVIRLLAAAGANVAADQDGESALSVAAHEGHTAAVEALVAAGADVNVKDKDGITPLMSAASSNRADAIRALLSNGASINATNNDGATALIAAAYGGHLQATQALLAGGADSSVRDSAGRTAMMASALGGNVEVTRVLLAGKADPLLEDNNGLNALVYAASTGHDDIVAELQKAGVKKGLDLALAYAIRGCRIPLATSLLSSGASLDAELAGDHLLIVAAVANCREGVEMLLGRGFDVNKQNEEGMTALMHAAGEGYADLVTLLLERGADMEIQNKENQSAWLFAAMGNHNEVVELLRADREKRGKSGPAAP